MKKPTEWEKIFANDTTNKGLISNIYKQLIQLNIKNIRLKMGRRTKKTFFQRGHVDGQQAREKMLNIANHQGNAIKTTMRYHLTLVRMAIIKNMS